MTNAERLWNLGIAIIILPVIPLFALWRTVALWFVVLAAAITGKFPEEVHCGCRGCECEEGGRKED